ncbi:hypothetical protein PYV61_09535, partial [Roseisolibacter sp. H3M3-2]
MTPLPRPASPAPVPREPSLQARVAARRRCGGVQVLYVVPDAMGSRDLALYCAERGVDLTWAPDIAQALGVETSRAPDLVHVAADACTPAHVEQLRALRAAHPAARLVVETWRTTIPSQVRLLDLGADAVVPAPCPVALLLALAGSAGRRVAPAPAAR